MRKEGMGRVVRIVVSCTDRKRLPAQRDLLLRNHPDRLSARASSWIERLTNPRGEQVQARRLYQGEHWGVVSEFEAVASEQGFDIDLWVASAGYGLVRDSDLVESYGATFSAGSEDSVSRSVRNSDAGEDAAYWWRRLGERPRPSGLPASLAELAADDPTVPLLVVLSSSYVRAVRDDLLAASTRHPGSQQVILVSAGNTDPRLARLRVPADARFQHSLGGSRLSLNARIAKRVLEGADTHEWDRQQVAAVLSSELERQPAIVRHGRRPLTDQQVIAFIEAQLASEPLLSRSTLLRRLRNDDKACEQKRFGRLFDVASQGVRS